MKVSFIGSGNVATHFAKACALNQIEVKEIYSKHFTNAEQLAHKCNATAVQSIKEISSDIDFLIVAISDNALLEIKQELYDFNCPVVHTSGSTSIVELASQHHHFGVLYPLQTFTTHKNIEIKDVPFFIESSNEILTELLKNFCEKLGSTSILINSEQRMNLHIAAVFACNFSNHMYAIASDIMKKSGLDFNLLKPLILETAHKIEQMPPQEAQTGPAVRNDSKTIEKHLSALGNQKHLSELYKAISEDIIKAQNK